MSLLLTFIKPASAWPRHVPYIYLIMFYKHILIKKNNSKSIIFLSSPCSVPQPDSLSSCWRMSSPQSEHSSCRQISGTWRSPWEGWSCQWLWRRSQDCQTGFHRRYHHGCHGSDSGCRRRSIGCREWRTVCCTETENTNIMSCLTQN